ncbi:hypothetical protein CPC08DRAFT_158760 [Agrocybe pediades]|nr:hypothetical protein CPC08DRAFT_158760 [Agrocybe pediades]
MPPATQSAPHGQDAKLLLSSPDNADQNDHDLNDDATFTNYRSLFASFPLLLHSVPRDLSSELSRVFPSSGSHLPSGISLPDLRPLKQIALAKSFDPTKYICQFEVPGGGTCRDEGCEDLHLSRLEGVDRKDIIEPNDDDAAEYLFNFLPASWLFEHRITTPSRILSALRDVRVRNLNNPLSLEERIKRAIEVMDSWPPT